MYKKAGTFEGKILETLIAEPKFNDDDNAFDVCLKIQGPDYEGQPQIDWWRGEMSTRYGKGNMAHLTQAEITLENLQKIGFEGGDLTRLDEQLIGKTVNITVESREYKGKTYYDIKYINGDSAPKAIAPTDLQKRMAAMGIGVGNAANGALKPQAAQPARAPVAAEANTDADPWG